MELEQILDEVHIAFTDYLGYQPINSKVMQEQSYIVSTYGRPSRDIIWINQKGKRLKEVYLNMLDGIFDIYGIRFDVRDDEVRYTLNRYLHTKGERYGFKRIRHVPFD